MSDETIDRTTLPIAQPPFKGVVERTLDGSQPDWDYVAPLSPPDDAPNVLLILIDVSILEEVRRARGKAPAELRGVTPRLVQVLREALDRNGYPEVRIVASGGFDAAKIRRFEELGVPECELSPGAHPIDQAPT